MNLLKELEKKLERIFEGFFTRSFRAGVQPIELAKKLIREMEEKKVLGVNQVYSPNRFQLKVSPEDKEDLADWEAVLVRELEGLLIAQAKEQGYKLITRPEIEVLADDKLALGEVAIESHLSSDDVALNENDPEAVDPLDNNRRSGQPSAPSQTRIISPVEGGILHPDMSLIVVEGSGEVFPLTLEVTTLGRSASNDIAIKDPNVSRHHAEILRQGDKCILSDLDSTNGTKVNGKRINRHTLKDGDDITLGHTDLSFRRSQGV